MNGSGETNSSDKDSEDEKPDLEDMMGHISQQGKSQRKPYEKENGEED